MIMFIYIHMRRPSTIKSVEAIEGVSENWLKQHGEAFLKRVTEFCSHKENISMDVPLVVIKPPEEVLVS